MNSQLIGGIIVILVCGVILTVSISNVSNLPMHNETVPCYDFHINMIKGANCTQEVYDDNFYNGQSGQIYGLMLGVFFIGIVMGLVFVLVGIIDIMLGVKR